MAEVMFEEMPERDVTTWNAMILGFSETGFLDKVLVLFRRMRLAEIIPDSLTIISLTQASESGKELVFVRVFHCLGIRIGVSGDVSVSNTWVSAYAKCGDLRSAKLVFGEIPNGLRSVVSWNSMISGCAYLGKFDEVSDYLQLMNQNCVQPDLGTVLSLLSLFGQAESLVEGMMIHSFAIKAGFSSDVAFVNTLISLYSKCGEIEAAQYCFDSLSKRTCVTWTALISGYAKVGEINRAFALFHGMEASGEKPDAVTVVAILSVCSQTGNLELGQSMNQYTISNGLEGNVVVCNALIDMYAKCGSMADASRLFYKMHNRTIVSWTAMIMGYAMNGQFREALDLFSEMLGLGIEPNHVTFLGVLQACTHGGFLKKGWYYFDMMKKAYQIVPRLEHYACMVDLFGRWGKLRDALEFVESMHVEPDAGVWGALLGACITHRETEIGEYAASRLFELEPNAAVSYIGIANIYAARERWEGVAKIRAMMKREGVSKLPGQSIVQLNGRGHAFTVEDRSHPEGLLIYEMLDGLTLHLKEKGRRRELLC